MLTKDDKKKPASENSFYLEVTIAFCDTQIKFVLNLVTNENQADLYLAFISQPLRPHQSKF